MIKETWAEYYGGRMTILDHLKKIVIPKRL